MIVRRTIILPALLLVSTLVASGQASSAPPAGDTLPAANPARPTVTNPATLTPIGYLQFEQGYEGALNSPETDAQYSVVQVIKLTVSPRVMLQAQSQPFARSRTDEGGATTLSNDPGDVLIGGEFVLYTPKESEDDAVKEAKDRHRHSYVKAATPTVTAGYLGRVYQGTAADLDIGSVSQTFIVLASGHAPFIDVHYDTNFLLNEQKDSDTNGTGAVHNFRRAQYGETFSIDRPIGNPNLQFSAEIYHFSQPLVHATSSGLPILRAKVVSTLFALSYQFRPNLVVDAGFSHGLTSTSTEWQSVAGVTYVLPHRLWAGH